MIPMNFIPLCPPAAMPVEETPAVDLTDVADLLLELVELVERLVRIADHVVPPPVPS